MTNYPPGPPLPPPPGSPGYPGQPYPGQAYPVRSYPGMPGGVAGHPYASFGTRLGAYLLDGLLYGLVAIPFLIVGIILIVIPIDCRTVDGVNECDLSNGGLLALGIVTIIAGYALMIVLYLHAMANRGQPWGARIVGVKVVDADGMPPGWGKALGRGLFQAFVSGNLGYLGYLWMLWDDNSQTLQDKVASTYVVRV